MKITITIPDEHINNALAGPHSRYWATECKWDTQTQTGYVIERDGSKRHRLTAERVDRAIQIMVGGTRADVLGRIIEDETDGPDGDILLQLMAFGELRYG